MEFHGLVELLVVVGLRPQVRLLECLEWLFHEPDAHPLVIGPAYDRPMVGPVHGELALGHPGFGFVRNGNLPGLDGPLLITVDIVDAAIPFDDGLEVLVDVVDATRCMHPTRRLVESLVDEELSPGHGAVSVQAFIAPHVQL